MKVVVPEGVDVGDLVGAGLARDDLGLTAFAAALALAVHAAVLHEAAHRRVARHGPERRVLLHEHEQVVVVELVRPTSVLGMLLLDGLRERLGDARVAARVLGHLARERAERVLVAARRVVHLLDRLDRVAQHLSGRRVAPRRLGERLEARRELPGSGGEASSGPMIEKRSRAQRRRAGVSSS